MQYQHHDKPQIEFLSERKQDLLDAKQISLEKESGN